MRKRALFLGFPKAVPVLIHLFNPALQRGLTGVRGPVKTKTAQLTLDGREQNMLQPNNTTTSKTVKIFAPFRLDAAQRKVMVDGQFVNVAAPAGRQQGDYLYTSTVTLLHEQAALYTTAPAWASVEIR